MRVLIIQDQLRIGGTEKQSLQMATDLMTAGEDPVMLLFRPGGELLKAIHAHPFPMHILQSFDSGISLWAPGLKRKIKEVQPDILMCMGRTANCYAGYLAKCFPDKPVIATVRTGKKLLPMHTWSLARAHCIIVNTTWWRQALIKRGFQGDTIHIIHNPVLLDRSLSAKGPPREELREEFGAAKETCVFLNVSTFRHGKRHMDLLKAFHHLLVVHPECDVQLWLVGSGRTVESCRKWCTANRLEKKVRFLGYKSNPAPCYEAADVAVSLSREDSLPNFLIEAQLFGLPVVARDYKGVRETFDPGKSGVLLKTGTPSSVVPVLNQMASDHDLRLAYSDHAQSFAARRFDPSRQSSKLLKLLKKVMQRAN